jgi:hypothetical protein
LDNEEGKYLNNHEDTVAVLSDHDSVSEVYGSDYKQDESYGEEELVNDCLSSDGVLQ